MICTRRQPRQVKACKQVAGTLKLELAQYREVAAFAQFGSDLDASTQHQLNRGARLVELLKQKQFQPLPIEEQIVLLFAGVKGFLDGLPVNKVGPFEELILKEIRGTNKALKEHIAKENQISKEFDTTLRSFFKTLVANFKKDNNLA